MNFDKESKSGKKNRPGEGGVSVVENGASRVGKLVFPIYECIITYKIQSSKFLNFLKYFLFIFFFIFNIFFFSIFYFFIYFFKDLCPCW